MIILFRPGLENNLVANAVIKLNVTVAELLLVWFLNCLIAMSRNQQKKKKKKKKMKKCNGISSNCMSWIDE